MIILASETISKRRNLPVKLEYVTAENDLHNFYWFVDHSANGGTHFENFEDVKAFIREKKLLTTKQLEKINGIKASLLKSVEYKLKELQRIEGIRDTPEYRGAKDMFEIRQQLKEDLNIPYNWDAEKLIMLHYLKEIGDNLYEIIQELQDR